MSLISLKKVSKFYYNKNSISSGFSKINMNLDTSEFVVITGESGSGKSTLLNVISGLDSYEEGEMYINGKETSHYSEVDYEQYRRKYIGNIFQNFNLVNSYTVYQNIELVLLLNGYKRKEIRKKILNVIDMVGLTKYKNTKASKLSGGQKQRVAIARALVKETPIIVADEPTGNLDVKSAKSVMKLLSEIAKNKLVVIVTHNYEQVEEYATRKITMSDGKIIEDKKIKDSEIKESTPIEYKNITFFNKVLLGLRNTFNIKTKFILLLLVYFFLTVLVFSSYSSIRKIDHDNSFSGYNAYFKNNSVDRIIINKKDKTPFTIEEFNKLKNLKNIERVVENDLFLDISVNMSGENYDFYGPLDNINNINKVSIGRMPSNDKEIVVAGNPDDYILSNLHEAVLKDTYKIYDNDNYSINDNIKIVGIVYDKKINEYDYTLYVPNSTILSAEKLNNINRSNSELTINGKVYTDNSPSLQYKIIPKDGINNGEAIISDTFSSYCYKEKCEGTNFHLHIKNSYYEENIDFIPQIVFNQNTFNKYTGFPKDSYYDYTNAIFISNDTYNKLFLRDSYQASIFVKDVKNISDTKKELDKLGYNSHSMKDMIVNVDESIMGILRLFRVVSFVISIIVLFFISYFIIRIILKSRNIYYSIIRILGSTRVIAKNLLMLELFNDINIAYLVFLSLVFISKNDVVKIKYIKSLIEYFKFSDYIFVYVVLISMSLLISCRYSRKLFTKSALETYREES